MNDKKHIAWKGNVEINDHDLLIQMNQKLSDLCTHFSNHIKHHWMVTIPLLMITAGLVVALLVK